MRISARCDYGCKALLELSLHWPSKEPVQIHEISEKQGIPERYLVQLLIQLKRAGFVASSRGKQGGYNLAKAPKDISLGAIMREMGGPLLPAATSATAENSAFAGIWSQVEGAMAKILDSVSFEDIRDKAYDKESIIMYQI